MRKHALIAVAVVAACLTPSVARAQRHSGAWLSAGAGVGITKVRCDTGCDADSETGGMLFVGGGVAASEKLLFGAEFGSWTKEFDDANGFARSLRLNSIHGVVLFYPADSSGIFVKGGFGIAYANVRGTSFLVNPDLGAGTGITYGVGYDISLGGVYLTPAVGFQHGFLGDAVEVVGVPIIRGWRHDILQFTVALTFQ